MMVLLLQRLGEHAMRLDDVAHVSEEGRRPLQPVIRNLRRGRMPSVERLQVLCEVVNLEFYIGPARAAGAIDERRLREAVASTERTLGTRGIPLEPEAKADAIAAIYDLLDRDRALATAVRVEQIIEALGRTVSHESAAEPLERDPTR